MEGDIKVSGVRNSLYTVALRMSGICTASNFRNQTNKWEQQQKTSNVVQDRTANHGSGDKCSLLSVFVNKVLPEQSHTHSFTYCYGSWALQ